MIDKLNLDSQFEELSKLLEPCHLVRQDDSGELIEDPKQV